MTRRLQRVASVIRSTVARAIQTRISDPRLARFTSVTRVEVAADLSTARVYVSVMADEPQRRLSLQALQSAAGRIRAMVAEQLTVRQVPRLVFHLDDSLRKSFQTVQKLDELMAQTRPGPADESQDPRPHP